MNEWQTGPNGKSVLHTLTCRLDVDEWQARPGGFSMAMLESEPEREDCTVPTSVSSHFKYCRHRNLRM